MELIDIIEYFILISGLYYLYDISTNYLSLKSRREFYAKYKIIFALAMIGNIGIILNFQTFWFTSYFETHRYLEIFVKIVLFAFSIINQFLVYELDEESHKMKRNKNEQRNTYYNSDGKLSFQIVNRLFLLIILYKFFNRNS